jgi:methionyl-tRNA formyltransferase
VKLAKLGGDLLVRALDLQAKGLLEFTEQDEQGVIYAEKIESSERRLDPEWPAAELAAKVRALNPHVGTFLELPGGERLGVRRAHAVEVELKPGRLAGRDGALLLGCREGALQLDEVQPPGGKPMPADAYLRGHPLPGQ